MVPQNYRKLLLTLSLLPAVLVGCAEGERVARGAIAGAKSAGTAARTGLGMLDPSGLVQETRKREDLWRRLRDRIDELDIDGVNWAVDEVNTLARDINERIDAIRPEDLAQLAERLNNVAGSLERQVADADIPKTTASVRDLGETVNSKLTELNTAQVNDLLADLVETTRSIRRVLGELERDLGPGVTESRQLLRATQTRVEELPLEDIRGTIRTVRGAVDDAQVTIAQIPSLAEDVGATLGLLRILIWVAIVVLVIAGLVGLFRLVDTLRGPRYY